MTDSERMQALVERHPYFHDADHSAHCNTCFLLSRLKQRDKTIAELEFDMTFYHDAHEEAKRSNAIMLSALESALGLVYQITYMVADGQFMNCDVCELANKAIVVMSDTIAQVKAVTVSKQEESTVSEVASEQTNKDSLHVARQNNPTHPTEQINRLAQEVATDMQWRGERNE